MSVKFTKPPLPLPQQLQLWEQRGLSVPDPTRALHYLRFIGYYRLSAYALPFQQASAGTGLSQPDKPFRPGTAFEDILRMYVFDRELRLLVMDAIERIEVAVRTCVANEMAVRHGAHWFMEPRHFHPRFNHARFLGKLEEELKIQFSGHPPTGQHHEPFINHYYQAYGEPYLPPVWMVAEMQSLGVWSRVFGNLQQTAERRTIAAHFGVDEQVLHTWTHALTHLRNLCAHHSRLWNRRFVIRPKIARKHAHLVADNGQFYVFAIILHDLLRVIAPGTKWAHRLTNLLRSNPTVSLAAMGFPAGWQQEPFWQA